MNIWDNSKGSQLYPQGAPSPHRLGNVTTGRKSENTSFSTHENYIFKKEIDECLRRVLKQRELIKRRKQG